MDRLLQIVQGCHKYDRRSQRLFYERYYGYALRISFRYVDAYEEATQQTTDMLLIIFRNFSGFKHRLFKNAATNPAGSGVPQYRRKTAVHRLCINLPVDGNLC
jgi:hypothetical protein